MEAVEDQRMLLSPAGADHVSLIHGGKINSSINTPASKSLKPTTAMILDTKADTNIPEGLRDELICHVLSFLPTKDAVRTSILSKRWRYLWTNITNFLFCDPLAAPLDTERDYNFVDRVFHHCSSDPIQRLCLNTRRAEFYRVKAWIDEAIRRNVCELELRLVKFPSCVFTCKTLRVLKLHARNESKYEIPTSFYLPSLKILYILLFNPLNNLTEKLFSSCPALEDLHVLVFGVKKDSCFVISAPVLKRLKLELYIEPSNCKFIINAPNLKYMDIFDGQMSDYEVQKVSPVAQAKLRLQVIFCGPVNDNHETIINNRALELLKGLIGVKSMSLLGASTMKVLGRAFQHDHHLMFSNMTRLELINFEPHGRKILLRLLQVCPKLEVLILKKNYKILGTVAVASDWSEPQISPVCLSLCLELVEIEGFEGNGFELKLVEYLLVHAAVIKKLTINAKGMAPETKVELSKRLSEFPRSSTTCQVHIMG